MDAADIYRYSERGRVDAAIQAMQDRITEELHAERDQIGGLPRRGLVPARPPRAAQLLPSWPGHHARGGTAASSGREGASWDRGTHPNHGRRPK